VAEHRAAGRFARDSASILVTQLGVTVLGLGTSVITARALGPHDRGLFQLLVLLPTTLSNFAKLGIPQANVYFMRRRSVPAGRIAANSVWLALVLGGGLAAACWVWRATLLAPFLKDAPVETVPLVLVLLPFVILQTYFMGIIQAQERFREYNVQQVMPTLLALVAMPVALLWLRLGLIGAVVAQTLVTAAVTLWLAWRVWRVAPFDGRPDVPLLRGMLSFGGKTYLQTLASTLHFRVDQYMIGYLLDPAQVGLYAIAVNLTNLILRVPDATGTVLFPRLAGASEHDAHAQTAAVCRHTLFITVVAGLAYLGLGGIAIRVLYGEAYAGAIAPMMLMLPGIVMLSLYLLLTRNFTSRNRQEVNIAAAGTALAVNVALNAVLIPRLGISGAAISTAVSYSLAAVILLVVFRRESGTSFGDTLVVRRHDFAGYRRLAGRALGAAKADAA
jgi:O-antigen/teichoic acid export membrane protein